MGIIVEVLKAGAVKPSQLVAADGGTLKLAPGDILRLPDVPIRTLRDGNDLIIRLSGEVGARGEQIVVQGFFAPSSFGLVQIGNDERGNVITPQSDLGQADPTPVDAFDTPGEEAQETRETAGDQQPLGNAQVLQELGVGDTATGILPGRPAARSDHSTALGDALNLSLPANLPELVLAVDSNVPMQTNIDDRFLALLAAPDVSSLETSGRWINGQHKDAGDYLLAGRGQDGLQVHISLVGTSGSVVVRVPVSDSAWRATLSGDNVATLGEGPVDVTVSQVTGSGQIVSHPARSRLIIDTIAPEPPAVELSPALADGAITAADVAGDAMQVRGSVAPGTRVRVDAVDRDGGVATLETVADGDGRWALSLAPMMERLADGTVRFEARSIDAAGNSAAADPWTTLLRQRAPAPPRELRLTAASDTALRDSITSDATPEVEGATSAGFTVLAYRDHNLDGFADALEYVGSGFADQSGRFTLTLPALGDGQHPLLFHAVDEFGQVSTTNSALRVTVDTLALAPVLDTIAEDDRISYAEAIRPTVLFTGRGEAGASIRLRLTNGTNTLTHTGKVEENGVWSIAAPSNTSAPEEQWRSLMHGFGENFRGHVDVEAVQVDVAGNVSTATERTVFLRTVPVPDVTALSLAEGQDTGRNSSDGVTRLETLGIRGLGPQNMLIRIYEDVDGDGTIDLSDDRLLQELAANSLGAFSGQVTLPGDGRYSLLAVGYDPASGSLGNIEDLRQRLQVTVDTEVALPTFDAVSDDNIINLPDVATTGSVVLSGTGEPGAMVSLVLEAGSLADSSANQVLVGDDGRWSTLLTLPAMQLLGNGVVTMRAIHTDLAGNQTALSDSPVRTFEIRLGVLEAPRNLVLDASDDTGVSATDGITRRSTDLTLRGTAVAGYTIHVYHDTDGNGLIDEGDLLGVVVAQEDGRFALETSLAQGTYRIRAEARDDLGQTSGASAALTMTVDTAVVPVSDLALTANNVISAAKANAGLAVLTGVGEPGATVRVEFSAGDAEPIVRSAVANALTGIFSVALEPSTIALIGDGARTATVVQEDLAGNVSTVATLDFRVDTAAPDVLDDTSAALAAAYNASPERPWRNGDEAGTITWDEVRDAAQGSLVARTITVGIPFAQGVAAGDTARMVWGTKTVDHEVTAADIARGFAVVGISGDRVIENREFQNFVEIRARYTDQADNVGATFTVLSGIDASLAGSPPTLEFDPAHYSSYDSASNTYHSRFSADSRFLPEKSIAIRGRGAAGDQIVVFADRDLDGIRDEGEVLAVVGADDFGNYNALLSLPQGTYSLRAVGTAPVSNGALPSPGEIHRLVINTTPPEAPVLGNPVIAGDGWVSAAERDAGVLVHGTGVPGNTITLQLGNATTGVMGRIRSGIPVAADGTWTAEISLVQWGQVGDGVLQLRVSQVDLAGNMSAYFSLPIGELPTVVMDTFARAPTVDFVAGDDRIGATEASSVPLVTGGAEPMGQVVLLYTGTAGTRGPITVDVNEHGRWFHALEPATLAALGNGQVQLAAYQIDVARNRSADAVRAFTIDTQVVPPTLGTIAGNNTINASERALGVELAGTAEAGATVIVRMTGSAAELPPRSASARSNGAWSLTLSPEEIDLLGGGTAEIVLHQVDSAGNRSQDVNRTITIATGPLTPSITLEAVGGDNILSVPEQEEGATLAGSAPIDSQVVVRLDGAFGPVNRIASVNGAGRWTLTLSRDELQAVLGPGDVAVSAYAVNEDGQSTALTRHSFRIELPEPSPILSRVGGDGFVNAVEAGGTVVVGGGGEPGHVVTATVRGTTGASFVRTTSVGTDRKWSATLSPGDIALLGDGPVSIEAIQRASTNAGAATSLPTTGSFVIDTTAPLPPNSSDESAANAFNSAVSDLAGGVTLTEAADGVVVAVPLPQDAVAGDRVVLRWGQSEISRILQQEDIPLLGTRVAEVDVAAGTIVAAGSGVFDVSAIFFDSAGNASAPFMLASNLSVTAPPQAVQFSAIYGDAYINAVEFGQISASGGQIGGTATGAGHVALTLTGQSGQVVVFPALPVSGGAWTASLSASQLLQLGEGRITASAVFHNQAGAQSAPATLAFFFDRTAPDVPDGARQLAADVANARGGLAGGLIRMDGIDTEAAAPVRVHVPLGANVTNGDTLTLFWGSEVLNAVVQSDDVTRGYAVMTVSPQTISQAGDDDALAVEARVTDRAGNTSPRFAVWQGRVDAAPLPPEVSGIGEDGLVSLAEAQAGWTVRGQGGAGGSVNLRFTGRAPDAGGPPPLISRTSIPIGDNGLWQVTLTLDDARLLGNGAAMLSVTQTDDTGNQSGDTIRAFGIDLDVPEEPTIEAVAADDRISFVESQSDVTIGGVAETGARVTVVLEREGARVEKSAVAEASRWSAVVTPADLLILGGGAIPITITATQTDAAGNVSDPATRSFRYTTDAIPVPVVSTVTGITPGIDVYFNADDLETMHATGGAFTVTGTGHTAQPGFRVRLTAVNADEASFSFEIPMDAHGAWTKVFDAAEFAALGQGGIRISATQISPEGDESVTVTFATGHEANVFFIDTVAPVLASAAIAATGFNGNAKTGDQVIVTVLASEIVQLEGLNPDHPPSVTLDLGSGQTRVAHYDPALSAAAGAGRLVFVYTVMQGDSAAGMALAANALTLNGVTLRDNAGNPAANAIGTVTPSSLLIDTLAPSPPLIAGADAADPASVGGAIVNLAEAAGGTRVRVNLTGTGAMAGDTVILEWRAGTESTVVTKQITAADLLSGEAVVLVAQTVVGRFEGTVALSVRLRDAAGNMSDASAEHPVAVDTIAPASPTFANWMSDNKVNKAEVDGDQITALSGALVEDGATVAALLVQGMHVQPLGVALDGEGRWFVSREQMVAAITGMQDGAFSVRVTQTDAAGNTSDMGQRNYFLDRQRPEKPTILAVPAADDGWVNLRDAAVTGVVVRISLANTGAVAGDSLIVAGFSNDHVHTITAAEVGTGLAVLNLPASAVLQQPGTLPQVGSTVRARIEDQGGNVSALSDGVIVNIDTIVLTPIVDTTQGAAAGITRAMSRASVDFMGTGVEPGAIVQVRLSGITGNSFLLPTTAREDGTFRVRISPTDMADLGDGPVSYEVTQFDAALNISTPAVGGFELALTVRPPTLLLMTADNVVSAAEAAAAGTPYGGLGVPGATVNLTFFVRGPDGVYESTPRLTRTGVPVQPNGTWSITMTSADFTALTPAGQGSVQIRGVQVDTDGSESGAVTQEFYADRFPPTLATTDRLRLFDGNGDGANNDGLLIRFAEPVLVSELRNMTTYATQAGRRLGTDARVEAVDSRSINGQYYATQFKLFLDGDHNMTTGNTVTIKRAGIIDAGGNQAAVDQVITLPFFVPPGLPTPPIDIMDDNRINALESADIRRLVFRAESAPADLGAALGGLMEIRVDDAVVGQVIPKVNFLTMDLTLANPARLYSTAALSAVVRVTFVDNTTRDLTLWSTGNPETAATAQAVYQFTSKEVVDLVNVRNIQYISSGLGGFTLPDSTITRTSAAGASAFTATLRFANTVRLAAGTQAWVDMNAYFTDFQRWETVRLRTAPGTAETAAGVTELHYTFSVNRPTSTEFLWESYGGVTLDPGITVRTTGPDAPRISAGFETNVVMPTSDLGGNDVLSTTLLDVNLASVPGSSRTLSYAVQNPNKLEFSQSLPDALAAAGRKLVLYVDGRPVSEPVTMGISSLLLRIHTGWETQSGTSVWGSAQRLQAGDEVTAHVRVTFRTPVNGQTHRDVLVTAIGDQAVNKDPLEFVGTMPADIVTTNVSTIAYLSGSISQLHPQQVVRGWGITTSQMVDLPSQAWADAEDGLKQLTAQITTADGSLTSVFSAPKQIRLDRRVGDIVEVRLLTDANGNGLLDAGDTIQLRFDENVQFTFGALPASFGQNPLLTPLGGENGFSSLWNIRLGAGATLQPGQGFALDAGEVFDTAGNTNAVGAPTAAALAADVMTAANAPVIDNVGVGNVIDDLGRPTAVRVLLDRAKAGDTVRLRIDGIDVVTATVASDGQTDIIFQVDGSALGADGERSLTSTIRRGDVETTSVARMVYVQDDQSHWSREAAYEGKVYWFDPDALVAVDGSVITTWQASAGGITLANTVAGSRTVRMTDMETGRAYLVTDTASVFLETAVNGAYLYRIPTMARFANDSTMPNVGYTDFMLFKPVVEGAQTLMQHPAWRFTSNAAVSTYTPMIGGVAQPTVTTQPYTQFLRSPLTRYTFGGVSSTVSATDAHHWIMFNANMGNAMTLGAWQFVTEMVRNNSISMFNQMRFNVAGNLASYVPNAHTPLNAVDLQNISPDNPARRFRIGGGYGVLGDQISISEATNWAYTQEIGAYLAAKYQSTGAVVGRREDRTYDLATSDVAGVIIDQILRLNDLVSDDVVTVAGADYVLAGSGNDTIRLRDMDFRHLDGGLGTDTLLIDNEYTGFSNINLSDYVSNARGLYGTAADNQRVNDAGYHRLMGLEVIDLVQDGATSNRRQILTIAAADVKQLSESGTLEVRLGKEDVLRTSGFSSAAGTAGIFEFNGRWYDRRYSFMDSEGTYTLYSSGGDRVPGAVTFRNLPALRQLHFGFDHAMLGSVIAGDFSIQTFSGPSVIAQSAVSIDLRQGVALTLSGELTSIAKITYNGAVLDDGGRGFAHNTWLIGTDGRDTLSGLALTAAEQTRGAVFMGGAGDDVIVGTAGADVIIGGLGADVLTGGQGSDTFLYRNEITGSGGNGGLGGASGDIMTDFTMNAANPANNDRLDLSQLFEKNFLATGNAVRDADRLVDGGFMEILKRINPQTNREDIQIWVDRDGGGAMGLLTTIADGASRLPDHYPAVESSRALLERMLEEGRLVVATY